MTTTAAKAVKTDNKTDLAGKLSGSKIPNATPVFRTYVMLKNPSMTEIDSLRSKRFWISVLVQRSSASVAAATTTYGSRPWNLNGILSRIISTSAAGLATSTHVWYSRYAFSTEVQSNET